MCYGGDTLARFLSVWPCVAMNLLWRHQLKAAVDHTYYGTTLSPD